MTKPTDFYIGVVEFFALLLPGAAITYLILPNFTVYLPVYLQIPYSKPIEYWILFFVIAYIAGHFLHGLGSLLLDTPFYGTIYPVLRKQFKKWIQSNPIHLNDDENGTYVLLDLVKIDSPSIPNDTNYYHLCMSYIRVNVPIGASEVDRLQADSKFFRSMVFVFLAAAIIAIGYFDFILTLLSIVSIIFSLWRFCYLRHEATKREYEFYLISRKEKVETMNHS